MNYIAHIHLGQASGTSLVGNFLGDFIKGRDLSYLAQDIRLGVQLHRRIDSYTDTHPDIQLLKEEFPSPIRRMSGVILDVYFDHLLMRNWQTFSDISVEQTFEDFYTQLENWGSPTSKGFIKTRERLLQYRWLIDYKQEQTCHRAYTAIENRLKGKVEFADRGYDFVSHNRKELEYVFQSFYPALIDFTHETVKELK